MSNLIRPEREASSYLIPSLSMLKGKVDRVFGSQPMIPLSQKRKDVDVDVCGSRVGKEQFRVYAEIALGIRGVNGVVDGVDGVIGEKSDGDDGIGEKRDDNGEKDTTNESVSSEKAVDEMVGDDKKESVVEKSIDVEKSTNETTIDVEKSTNETTIDKSIDNTTVDKSIDNTTIDKPIDNTTVDKAASIDNSTDVDNPIATDKATNIERTTDQPAIIKTTTHRRYRYTAIPPSPSSLPSLLRSHNLPGSLFPIIHQVTDFDTNSYLVKCHLADDLPHPRGTRCEFWREILSQQFPSQPQRLFRRYVYAKPPPRLSGEMPSSALPTQMTVFPRLGTL